MNVKNTLDFTQAYIATWQILRIDSYLKSQSDNFNKRFDQALKRGLKSIGYRV